MVHNIDKWAGSEADLFPRVVSVCPGAKGAQEEYLIQTRGACGRQGSLHEGGNALSASQIMRRKEWAGMCRQKKCPNVSLEA